MVEPLPSALSLSLEANFACDSLGQRVLPAGAQRSEETARPRPSWPEESLARHPRVPYVACISRGLNDGNYVIESISIVVAIVKVASALLLMLGPLSECLFSKVPGGFRNVALPRSFSGSRETDDDGVPNAVQTRRFSNCGRLFAYASYCLRPKRGWTI